MIWFINLLRKIPGWEKGTAALRRLQELSLTQKLFLVYSVFAIYFLLYHEAHLPLFWMIGLALVGYIASGFLFWGIVVAFRKLETKVELPAIFAEVGIARPTTKFVPWIEASFFLIPVLICFLTGFFENRSGILFLAVYAVLVLLIRLIENKVYYKIGLLGFLILAAGLSSFKALQLTEVWVAYIQFKPTFEEKDLTNWGFDESTRSLSNPDLKLSVHLPEDFYFHNPKDLGLESKTGVGQIAGIISTSETDWSRYPSIRIFYYPQRFEDDTQLVNDFKKFLDSLLERGDIQEVNELERESFEDRYYGKFWTFYDVLRPRYAKTGIFILSKHKEPYTLVFLISESLIKGRRHEESVEKILSSVKIEE
ncbi:hypothetical protein EHQ53_06350 [Leptospira langatensis]|uniref:Uncharacterized protein n=1 Tax=Leptospira langatensis TaxID=2484983 RepID=A0A5F1ZVF5_9LEPT|nr:hypothetical protein EHO57_07185 [Leptospira langatensis]TGL41828.1 hypothetical protein EHQ53_06350 [Leptospira langatensis]